MLGSDQRATLNRFAEQVKQQPEIARLMISILPFRYFTREAGGGSGHPIIISLYEGDTRGNYVWIAKCSYDDTAVEKGKEIARYLVDQGCPKERIKVERRHG